MKAMILALGCVSLMLIAGLLDPTAALAAAPPVVRSLKVRISDLDLSRPQDRRTLRRRIERAAQVVCGPEPFIVTPDRPGYLGYETCYRRSLQGALATIQAHARAVQSARDRVASSAD